MRKFAVILGVLLALAGAACAKGTSGSTTVGGYASATTSASAAVGLADGRHYGELKAVTADPNSLTLKVQEYFSGEAANEAAVEDGYLKEGESVDDDVYVRDVPGAPVTLTVVDAPEVGILKFDGGSPETQPISYADFVEQFNAIKDPGMLSEHGFWVTTVGGEVAIIEEQFHP